MGCIGLKDIFQPNGIFSIDDYIQNYKKKHNFFDQIFASQFCLNPKIQD